jgi:membrane associated rhomboid family serine protease
MSYVYQLSSKRKNSFLGGLSVNTILIGINIIAFILFSLLINFKLIGLEYIAISPFNILNGKYLWTFLTSMFMHGGFFHLFANMLSLFFVGGLLEKILGRKRYLWFYLIAGFFSGILFVLSAFLFPQDMNTFAVGASGALFGLIGVLVLLTPNLPVYLMFIPIPIKMKYAAPGILVLLWVISVAGNVPIGNIAHFGGLLCGLGYGLYLRKKYKNKTRMISKRFS